MGLQSSDMGTAVNRKWRKRGVKLISQWFLNFAPSIPRGLQPVGRGFLDKFLEWLI